MVKRLRFSKFSMLYATCCKSINISKKKKKYHQTIKKIYKLKNKFFNLKNLFHKNLTKKTIKHKNQKKKNNNNYKNKYL